MPLPKIKLGPLSVSKLIIGANPFSGFSHQGLQRDQEMLHYHTCKRIKDTLKKAEKLGINTHLSRADHHVMRYMMEYWDEGGKMQWFAQTCPELGEPEKGLHNAIQGKAKAIHIHGGQMDYMLANNQLHKVAPVIKQIRESGLLAGIAGHSTMVFEWAEENVDVDYYMCSYYNPIPRDKNAEHVAGTDELYRAQDRLAMTSLIPRLSKPVIHYKVLGAGRNHPKEAFATMAQCMRPYDAVCVGIYLKDKPSMIKDDITILLESLKKSKK
jgi:hypothetical protein